MLVIQNLKIFGLLFILNLPKNTQGVTSINIIVSPEKILDGSNVTLSCLYDLDGKQEYYVQWYYGNKEFLYFAPSETPEIKFFAIPNLNIFTEKTNGTTVVLKNFTKLNNGIYGCEVLVNSTLQILWSSVNLKVVETNKQND